jgi:hypothetical protein
VLAGIGTIDLKDALRVRGDIDDIRCRLSRIVGYGG